MWGNRRLAGLPWSAFGIVCLCVAASLALPGVALAVAGDPSSDKAAAAVRWGCLIGLGVVLAILGLGFVFKAGVSRLFLGADNRISTSKTIAAVWTLVVAAALLGLVYANLLNHPEALDKTGSSGVIGQYAVLFGGPLGAAILAKQIVTSQVAKYPSVKTMGSPKPKDLIADDSGNTDLGDFQYVLFNLVALFYVVSTLLHSPLNGLPHIPDVLLGLTSVSAAGYVGKKAITPSAPAGAALPSPGQATLAPLVLAAPAPGAGAPAAVARASAASAPALRSPNSVPDPSNPAGTVNPDMPFDHIVVVMMENHSFDNLLGELPNLGRNDVEGLTFGPDGNPTNFNPDPQGNPVRAFPFPSTAQGSHVTQGWNACHKQINGGHMDGFVASVSGATQPMGYYPQAVLPFAYSLASQFTLANRWFSSAPCPTYPNRRFLLAGTAFGGTTTAPSTLFDSPPPNGTIFDRLDQYGINWKNYFTDIPMTAVIPTILERDLDHVATIGSFFDDCAAGALPAVSFVDPEAGAASELGKTIQSIPTIKWLLEQVGLRLDTIGGSEEDPQDMSYGERWAYNVVDAILKSPAWPRTLLIYTYDEHGGYYDHVAPPPAIKPDGIPPKLGAGDVPGGYDIYGPRVPAVVVSPYSKPNSVSSEIYDHTSVLATIEAKWNLPALTFRDANANTVMDFLDTTNAALINPPVIDAP